MNPIQTIPEHRTWEQILAPYKKSKLLSALGQLANTGIPFLVLWYLALRSLEVGYWLTLLLAIPGAFLLIRLFIFQHDCGHGSFFRSQKANNALGFVLGVLTVTPYQYWRRTHAIHHATSGNLDRREFGDITTLTVREYQALSRWGRIGYRLYRNTAVMLLFGPIYQFLLKQRLPLDAPRAWRKEWMSVLWTNLALAGVVVLMGTTVGYGRFLAVQLPMTYFSGILGVWLFYVQHQFEDTYWENREVWDPMLASLQGSSYYDLPAVLHWFTGNIGFHHIHHLSSRVPNYSLRHCFRENPEFLHVTRIKLWESFKCARLKLWDETNRRLVGFRELRAMTAA